MSSADKGSTTRYSRNGMGSQLGLSDGRWVAVMVLGLAALLGLRIAALRLNGTDLFFDEAQYWSWSLTPDWGYYSKPPLVAWLIAGATELCGHQEFCVRLPSPIVHTATALVIYGIGRALYSTAAGAMSALAFATLPGVSVSAGIISTDVPLLFFWALALYGLVLLRQTGSWWPALVLGVALGGGLNAKYAMAWFGLCLAVYLIATPRDRGLLKDARLWFALVTAAVLIAPNLLWNSAHKFATFAHTADNARWHGGLVNPGKALEFFAAQFGVFGPILFAALLVIAWRAWRDGLPDGDRLLLAFALPVLVIITMQALISRAHANWAAVSYVAASVLVTQAMIRDLDWRWLRGSMALHAVLLMAVVAATIFAGRFALPGGVDPFARTLGWRAVAEATAQELQVARAAGLAFAAVLTDDRSVTAELLYYMRTEPTPVLAWRSGPRPADHYELTRPYSSAVKGPVLLVGLGEKRPALLEKFEQSKLIKARKLAAGAGKPREVTFFALEGYKEK